MTIYDLRKSYRKGMNNIPKFITSDYYNVWDEVAVCNELILLLLTDKILNDNYTLRILMKFDEKIDKINLLCKRELMLKISVYLVRIMDKLLEDCVNYEFFEAAANIQKFSVIGEKDYVKTSN